MVRGIRNAFALCTAMAAACMGQPAASRPVDTPEVTAVREAGKVFVATLYGDTFEGVRAAFAGSKEDLESIQAFYEAVKVNRATYAVIDKAFPRGPADAGKPPSGPTIESSKAQIDAAEVKISGDTAEIEHTFALRKIDGAWRVVDLDKDDKPMIASISTVIAKASAETMAALQQGKFKSRTEAETALNKLIADGAKELHVGHTTTSTTQRSGSE
jgi:hypothetical protein